MNQNYRLIHFLSALIFFAVPLLQLLSVHLRVLVEWPLWRSFAALCGISTNDNLPIPAHCKETIPSLLADPIALMIKFILLTPLRMDIGMSNHLYKPA